MNAKKRMIIGLVVMPLVLIVMISSLFIKNYFQTSYENIENAVYINDGKSLLVAVKETDTTSSKMKFFELETGTNKVINSFSVETNSLSTLELKYDNNNALILVINDDKKNSALSVYNIYHYESGKTPVLISSDMQSDTTLLNVFSWRDGLSIIDKDTSGSQSAIYIKDGKVTKKLFTENADINNNIKRFSNETAVKDTDEVPYAEFSLYDGRTAYIGMFLDANGNFPVAINDKVTALKDLGNILYADNKIIKLYINNTIEYRVGTYTYGNESAKKILNPQTPIFNASVYYPNSDQTIVIGTAKAELNSQRVGYVYDNKTGVVLKDLTTALKSVVGVTIDENNTVYLSANNLCIIQDGQYYFVDVETGDAKISAEWDLLSSINKYDKYQLATFTDYAFSDQGRMLLINLALWIVFPLMMLLFNGIARKQKKDIAKKSKIITAKIVSINPTNMRMYGMQYMDFEVEAYIGGVQKTLKIKSAVPPGQFPLVGQSVVILFNPQNGKAMFADDKMVNAALGKPVVQEAVIEDIETIEVELEDIELARLNVSFDRAGEKVNVMVPAVQTSIMPFKISETINIRYMSNSMEDTVMVVGRGKNIYAARSNYSGEAEIKNVRNIGPDIDGRYMMDIDTICKAKIGNVVFGNVLLTKDRSVLQPGVKISFTADKELFSKRLKLQNMEQGIATVVEIEATGDSIGYSPVLRVTLKLNADDEKDDVLIANENISPLNIPKVGDIVLIGYDIETKEATIIRKM